MIKCQVADLIHAIDSLSEFERWTRDFDENDERYDRRIKRLVSLVELTNRHAQELELNQVKSRCEFFLSDLKNSLRDVTLSGIPFRIGKLSASEIRKDIGVIIVTINQDLAEKNFTFIPSKKSDFFEKPDLFGLKVHSQFPSVAIEIKEAGNCIAADLNTAAVFHLMRAAELGLRSLADHFGAKIKNKPLELAGWDDVIKALESKIEQKLNPKTPKGSSAIVKPVRKSAKKKADDREFYRGVMGEFYAFKDVWRNSVMHTRSTYNESEALGVFLRVKDFMVRLSEQLSEVKT